MPFKNHLPNFVLPKTKITKTKTHPFTKLKSKRSPSELVNVSTPLSKFHISNVTR